MTSYYRTQGFVFKEENKLEADKIFFVFTKDFGRIEIFGKAIRKIASKLRGGMGIFNLSDLEFVQGRKRKTLIDAISVNKFKNIAEDPERLLIAFSISNLVDDFIKNEEKDQNIFNLLNETFNRLNDCLPLTICYQFIYYYFFWNFVSLLGHSPELSVCVACRKKLESDNLHFSNSEGGIICGGCAPGKKNSLKITSDVVKILRLILNKEWLILTKLKAGSYNQEILKKLSGYYYNYLSAAYS